MLTSTLRQVAQHVDDLDRAVAFYRDLLGLPLMARFDPPGLAFLDLGGTRLLLEPTAPSARLYLAVDDLERRVEELRARGVEIVAEPHMLPTDDGSAGRKGAGRAKVRMAGFRDSEGNLCFLSEEH
jgi:methylmalonyl-CoA/ethylmalonyl-CoA epimerase